MSQKPVFLTAEGLAKLQAELEHLCNVRRPEVADKIHRAMEMGGTTNNAEYDDAKNEQAFVEGRIRTIEQMIKNATLIRPEASPGGTVGLGSKVKVLDQNGELAKYWIVGSAEAHPQDGKISNESPVGQALLGKRVGDEVTVVVPAGVLKLKIVEIS